MNIPSILNRRLIAAGKIIGQLAILALVAGLFIAPVLAMFTASFYAAFGFAHLIGAGVFGGFVLFWVFAGLIGWYVSPNVQPQISNAMSALLRSEEENAALSWLKKSLETRIPGREASAIPGEVIETFEVLMERYPTAILDTSKLPLPKADMKCLFTRAWLTQTDGKIRNFLEIAYVHLSQFQDGVGDKPIDCSFPSDRDPAMTMAILEPYLRFSGSVTKEAEILRAEFKDFKHRHDDSGNR
jgi:hypothetical protein